MDFVFVCQVCQTVLEVTGSKNNDQLSIIAVFIAPCPKCSGDSDHLLPKTFRSNALTKKLCGFDHARLALEGHSTCPLCGAIPPGR